MKEKRPASATGTVRRCNSCQAVFRENSPGVWTLEYVAPDLFHQPGAATSPQRIPLMQSRTWEQWRGGSSGPPPLTTEGFGTPQGMAAQEKVRAVWGPARVVLPHTHTPAHAGGTTGAVWLTTHQVRIEVGSFRWSTPLGEVRSVRDAGGLVELSAGPTAEPLHLLVPYPAQVAEEIAKAVPRRQA